MGAVDVVVENFRPGVTDRLGISYADVRDRNPSIVYCSISGFGAHGELASMVALDGVAQAFAGALEASARDAPFGSPFPVVFADLAAASTAASGILAALLRRERTGRGCHIELTLLDCLLPWLHAATINSMGPPITQVVTASDGRSLLVQPALPHLHDRFLRLCASVPGLEPVAADARFSTLENVKANGDAYTMLVHAGFLTKPLEEWLRLLGEAGVPASPVHTLDQALNHPVMRTSGTVVPMEVPPGGTYHVVASPFHFDGSRRTPQTGPPHLGEHTAQVLRELLNTSDAELSRLRNAGVIPASSPD